MISSFDENLLPPSQVFMLGNKNNQKEPNLGKKVDEEVFRSVNQIIWPLQWYSCELVHCRGRKALFFARWGRFFFSMAPNRSNNEA